jgi:hypothetical protein
MGNRRWRRTLLTRISEEVFVSYAHALIHKCWKTARRLVVIIVRLLRWIYRFFMAKRLLIPQIVSNQLTWLDFANIFRNARDRIASCHDKTANVLVWEDNVPLMHLTGKLRALSQAQMIRVILTWSFFFFNVAFLVFRTFLGRLLLLNLKVISSQLFLELYKVLKAAVAPYIFQKLVLLIATSVSILGIYALNKSDFFRLWKS